MELAEFFRRHPKAAIAFSGGVDSAYLLYAALRSGADVRAYYVQSAFQPQFEREDAARLSRLLGTDLQVIEADVLCRQEIALNPSDRCYHCKKLIFSLIAERARREGYALLLDGTNASDDAEERPGMRALAEMAVRSPLRECGLSKEEIRRRSKEAGLFTWNKPAYACLATRIPPGERITDTKLRKIEMAEDFLFSLGFTDFRVRVSGGTAKLQLHAAQLEKLMECRASVLRELRQYFGAVTLDLEARDE